VTPPSFEVKKYSIHHPNSLPLLYITLQQTYETFKQCNKKQIKEVKRKKILLEHSIEKKKSRKMEEGKRNIIVDH